MGFLPDDVELDPVSPSPTPMLAQGRFLPEDARLDPVVPSLFSDPIGALTSSDWWLTRPDGQRISAEQAVVGPFSSALDTMTLGAGDEMIAGGGALVDALIGGPGYDARLAEARGIEENTPLAGKLAAGVPALVKTGIPTMVNKSAPYMKRVGQSLMEAMGYGAGYGFNEGEKGLANRAKSAAISGAIAAPFGAATEAVKPVLSEGARLAKSAAALFRSDDALAGEILNETAGPQIAAIVDDAANPLHKYRTLAEAAQNPKLAQLEQQVASKPGPANELLLNNDAARRGAQIGMLDNLSTAVPKSREAAGNRLRGIIEPRAERAQQRIEGLYSGIDQKSPVPFEYARRNITKIANDTYESGGMPGELSKAIRDMKAAQAPTRAFSYIHSLRKRFGRIWAEANAIGDGEQARIAAFAMKEIDSSISRAGKRGLMPKLDVDAFEQARKEASDAFDIYGMRGVGPAIQKLKQGQYQSKASNVVQNLFDGSAEGTRKILNAVGDDPKSIDQVRGMVRDQIKRAVLDRDKKISPAQFGNIMKQYEEGLSAAGSKGQRLFEADHIKALQQLSDDMRFLDPQSSQSVRSLAHYASRGQPTTAQRIFMEASGSPLSRAAKVPGPLVGIYRTIASRKEEAVNAILARAFIDRSFAKLLVSRSHPGKVARSARAIGDLLRGVSDRSNQLYGLGAQETSQAAERLYSATGGTAR